jgi:hypothetical protein
LGQWLAAGFDAVENIALLVLLFGRLASPWPQVAWVCAVLKFSLIILGIAYILYALISRLVARTVEPGEKRPQDR